mmetsp:Transcript_28218/g.39653  ORF Transcript_28218/g.39653 Transcript_28218/m.39653 type:complete len:136 (+) Transcript_28218:2-409(+)
MVGEDYKLKIIDFDLSYKLKGRKKCISMGTMGYRAPELRDAIYKVDDDFDYKACDIYSLGILLFNLATAGYMPFLEESKKESKSLKLLRVYFAGRNYDKFWERVSKVTKLEYPQDFKDLLNQMLDHDPQNRPSIN